MKTKTAKIVSQIKIPGQCPKCSYSLKMMKFKGEKNAKITCPDCGWREGVEVPAAATVTKAPKAPAIYTGSPIPATKLFKRDLPFGNCDAACFMAVNTASQTICYINAYGKKGSGEVQPRSSFDPSTYTYPLVEKVLAKKVDSMVEVEDHEEWPSFVIPAVVAALPTRSRRKSK